MDCKKLDIKKKNVLGQTALHMAVIRNRQEIVN